MIPYYVRAGYDYTYGVQIVKPGSCAGRFTFKNLPRGSTWTQHIGPFWIKLICKIRSQVGGQGNQNDPSNDTVIICDLDCDWLPNLSISLCNQIENWVLYLTISRSQMFSNLIEVGVKYDHDNFYRFLCVFWCNKHYRNVGKHTIPWIWLDSIVISLDSPVVCVGKKKNNILICFELLSMYWLLLNT